MASCQLESSARRLCEQCGSQNFEAWRLPTHNYWYEEKLHSTTEILNCFSRTLQVYHQAHNTVSL